MLLHYLPDGAGEAAAAVVTATLLIGPLLFSLVELAGRRRRPWSLLAKERNDAEPEIEHRSDLMATAVVDADALVMCAVCEAPSTTRCSRCKAVRYCSGKCQIIDWRSGHKVVCRAPRVDHHSLDHEEAKPFDGSAFTSKAERLHKILEEMEATLSSRRALHSIHSSPVASRPGPSKDAVDAASDLRLVEGSQSEELQALRVKLEQVTAERDTLSSKVELLRSEIKVLKGELNARPRIKMFEGFLL